jgi:hypothetical protein
MPAKITAKQIKKDILKIFKKYRLSPIKVENSVQRNALIGEFIANNYKLIHNKSDPFYYIYSKNLSEFCFEWFTIKNSANIEKTTFQVSRLLYGDVIPKLKCNDECEYKTDMIIKILSVFLYEIDITNE